MYLDGGNQTIVSFIFYGQIRKRVKDPQFVQLGIKKKHNLKTMLVQLVIVFSYFLKMFSIFTFWSFSIFFMRLIQSHFGCFASLYLSFI